MSRGGVTHGFFEQCENSRRATRACPGAQLLGPQMPVCVSPELTVPQEQEYKHDCTPQTASAGAWVSPTGNFPAPTR